MVHALLECWRVLSREGNLIDLRPLHAKPEIEVIAAASRFVSGHLVDEAGVADDMAAGEAMNEVVRRGQFALQMSDAFKFTSYWDTLEGMLAYNERKWRDTERLPAEVLDRTRKYIAGTGGRYRVCIHNTMHLALYRKQETPAD